MPRGDLPSSLRLFVAIELPDATKSQLTATAEALKHSGIDAGLRWVRPEGVHITLKFLGAVDAQRVEAISTALRIGLQDAPPFDLRPDTIGSFGGRRNLRVVWVGVGGDTAALTALAAAVERALVPLGFATEQRPFNAHLTLARVQDDTPASERERIAMGLARVPVPPFTMFHVQHISLMQSTLGRGGAVYQALNTFALGGRA
ncbi:MAG: RNA 2',3'-cyclic phosphodiesterase [Dehalococcoidia bacterium]